VSAGAARRAAQAGDGLRVLTVTNRWPSPTHHGGIFVKHLVEALRRQGHTVDVELVAQGRGKLDYALAAPRVRAAVRAAGYDVVHVHYGLSAPAAALVTDLPRVVSLYGSDINVWWQRWITKLSTRGFAAAIYVSRRLAATAGDSGGIVIPNGVDFGQFVPGDRGAVRAALGIRPDDRAVLFGASPSRAVKGWDLFGAVVDELKSRGMRAVPMVLSEPGQPTSGVVAKLDAADLLLFTSRRGSEGSPTVVKEAVAMGLPIVSVDVGDVAELLSDVEPSAVVPFPERKDESAARRELVNRLAEEAVSVLRKQSRANGRQTCARLDLDAVAVRVVAVYRDVLRQ